MQLNLLAICGRKNAGKTALIERLIPLLRREQLYVGVLKHDGHLFEADTPGTDSHRFLSAGSDAVAVYDAEKINFTKRGAVSLVEIARLFEGMDLILVEGWKHASCPKLEIVRRDVSDEPVSNSENRLAFVSDCLSPSEGIVLHPDDIERIAQFVFNAYRTGQLSMKVEL